MPVLITATSASKDAPEGFILRDIISILCAHTTITYKMYIYYNNERSYASLALPSEMSFDSTPTRAFLQQYLVNELCSTNNVFVKLRVLRCIMAVLEEGHIEFKQNLRKVPQPFNEASSECVCEECGPVSGCV